MGNIRRPDTHPKPVEKIELSEKSPIGRLALTIFLLAIGMIAIGYGISTMLSTSTGWITIDANSREACNADEFILRYNVGKTDVDATAERKALQLIYTQAITDTYQIFHTSVDFPGVVNIKNINEHPNEELKVNDLLYNAFELLDKANNRCIYLGPIYQEYYNLFMCQDESQTVDFNPIVNDEERKYFDKVLALANDKNHIDIELLGDNIIILHLSNEYLEFAGEMGIDNYIDFFWMKNAFVVDYIAETLAGKGFRLGSISSYDGFVRNLDDVSDDEYSFSIYDKDNNLRGKKEVFKYSGNMSIVYLRDYIVTKFDNTHYYAFEDGNTFTSFIDIKDGLCKSSVSEMVCYSNSKTCAEVLMEMIPAYISDELDSNVLKNIEHNNINALIP